MDLTYTPEQEAFREEVRSWLAANAPRQLPSAGTWTSVKNTSAKPAWPSSCTIGLASTPGDDMSIARNVIPRCFGASGSVRTSAKIQSANVP